MGGQGIEPRRWQRRFNLVDLLLHASYCDNSSYTLLLQLGQIALAGVMAKLIIIYTFATAADFGMCVFGAHTKSSWTPVGPYPPLKLLARTPGWYRSSLEKSIAFHCNVSTTTRLPNGCGIAVLGGTSLKWWKALGFLAKTCLHMWSSFTAT